MLGGLYFLNSLDRSVFNRRGGCLVFIITIFYFYSVPTVDRDQTFCETLSIDGFNFAILDILQIKVYMYFYVYLILWLVSFYINCGYILLFL